MVSVETTVIKMSFQLASMKIKNPKRKESDLNSVLVNRCVYIQRFPVYLCRGWDGVASLCCLSSFLKIKATCKSRRYLKTHYDTCLLGDAKCLVFHFFFFLITRNTTISDVLTATLANVSLRLAFQRDLNIKAFKQFEEVIRKFVRQ